MSQTEALLRQIDRWRDDILGFAGELIATLAQQGLTAEVVHGLVEVQVDGDEALDTVRDVVAQLGLPLHRMTSRLTSLDEVFVDRAGSEAP